VKFLHTSHLSISEVPLWLNKITKHKPRMQRERLTFRWWAMAIEGECSLRRGNARQLGGEIVFILALTQV
jgi:hypothetical protein